MTGRAAKHNRQRLISTHTPAWGVTLKLDPENVELLISTHTPAWGVTGGSKN